MIKFNPKTDAFISNALSHLKGLITLSSVAFGGTDPAVLFCHQQGCTNPRIAFLGPTGSHVPEIVNSLTGMSLREADLRESICEAGAPAVVRWLFEDGILADDRESHAGASVRQMHGERWQRLIVSGGLLNVGLPEGAIDPTPWIDRISIPVIITSARAVLGTAESVIIRHLQKEKRFFTLLVTSIDGDPTQVNEIRNEIDEYKIKPFMEKSGRFIVIYCQLGLPWMDDLATIVMNETAGAHCRQIVFVAQRWIDNWSARLEHLWEEEQKKRNQVNGIRMHLANTTVRLKDIARRTAANISLNITDLYSSLENTADKTAAFFVANMTDPLETLEDLIMPMKKAWIVLDQAIAGAPLDLQRSIEAEWSKETDSFTGTYRSILVRQPIKLPPFQTQTYSAAFESWQRLSLDRFSSYIMKTLEEMQAKYQKKELNEDMDDPGDGVQDTKLGRLATEVLRKVQLMAVPEDALQNKVSSIITEGLRRYVRDRTSRVTQAIVEDAESWFAEPLRCSLDAWRMAINGQLDEQLGRLKSEEYKGMLWPHRDVWRRLSIQAHTEI